SVKKSQGSRNRCTVFRLMWSASRKYGFVQPSSFTAASAAARVCVGSDPMIMCSRLDLFQTGVTSTPAALAFMQAASCAFAWCANRSPTPIEYFGRVKFSGTAVPVADPVTVPAAVAIVPPLQSTAMPAGHHYCEISYLYTRSTGRTNPQPSQNTRSSVTAANQRQVSFNSNGSATSARNNHSRMGTGLANDPRPP